MPRIKLKNIDRSQANDGDVIEYDESSGSWKPQTNSGGGGSLQGLTIYDTPGSGSFITGPNTNRVVAEVIGGGGGGGGALSVGIGHGAGGGSGGYAKLYASVMSSTEYFFVVGQSGSGGPGSETGSDGEASSLGIGELGVTVGGGGGGLSFYVTGSLLLGGIGGDSFGGTLNAGGSRGESFLDLVGEIGAGAGGNTIYGAGGVGQIGDGDGNDASGYGSGGGGACMNGIEAALSGGNGAPGVIVIEEWS
jgi:hypothetical protein